MSTELRLNGKKSKVLIIIPAFNEEGRIPIVIEEVKRGVPQATILVVNDGSKDKTEQRALAAGAKVLSHPFNLGYGAALQTGYKFALRYGFDHVVQMDGDGQHDPRNIHSLLQELMDDKADVVIGSRFLGQEEYRVPWMRRIGIGIFGFIAGKLVNQKISDPTSGYQALSRHVLELFVSDAFPGDYPDADVLVMLHRAGFRVREVPVNMRPSKKDKGMHSGLKPIYYTYKMLLSIMLNLLRKER